MKQGALVWTWAAVAATPLAVLACQPAPLPPPAAAPVAAPARPAAPVATPAEQPQRGGVLHNQGAGKPPHLNPLTTSSTWMELAGHPVYEGLLTRDIRADFDWRAEFPLKPQLAESWELADPTTYLFRLRSGVKWHDGKDFSAEDVAWTFGWQLDPANVAPNRPLVDDIQAMEVTGPLAIRVKTKAPAAWFLHKLQSQRMPILPAHVAASDGVEAFNKRMVGTGAFKLKTFEADRRIVYARNEAYWQPGKPYLDGMVLFYGLDPSARVAAIVAKELDILNVADRAQLDGLLAAASWLKYKEGLGGNTSQGILPHLTKPPFDDARVRRAVHLAIDRHGMNQVLLGGKGVVDPPGILAIKKGWAIAPEELEQLPGFRKDGVQDRGRAKEILAEAGYPQGLKSRLAYTASNVVAPPVAEVVERQLRGAGIEVQLVPLEAAAFTKAEETGNYDMLLTSLQRVDLAADPTLPQILLTGRNWAKFSDPQFDALYQRIETTQGDDAQKKLWRQLQDYLLDKLYVIPTISFPYYNIWQPYVHNWSSPDNHARPYQRGDMWMDSSGPKRVLP